MCSITLHLGVEELQCICGNSAVIWQHRAIDKHSSVDSSSFTLERVTRTLATVISRRRYSAGECLLEFFAACGFAPERRDGLWRPAVKPASHVKCSTLPLKQVMIILKPLCRLPELHPHSTSVS